MCFDIRRKYSGELKANAYAAPAPYTQYNIFVVLEREYYLQKVCQVQPVIEPSDVFDPSNGEYSGPPLPVRYSDLILHRDWHIRGKENRDRRIQGIGIKQLSMMISSVWATVDEETKEFCKTLSERSNLRYKEALFKGAKGKPDPHSVKFNSKPTEARPRSSPSSISDVSMDSENVLISFKRASIPSLFDESIESTDCLEESVTKTLFDNISFLTQYEKEDLVDMEDEEINEMWHSIHGPRPIHKVETSKVYGKPQGDRPQILFKKDPKRCTLVAQSA